MEEIIKNELEFYSKFARPLIINLPESTDRALASGWVKKIMDENMGSLKLRTDYLKLLLFALQRQKLVGIFADDPDKYEKLEEFPAEYDLNEMARQLIESEHSERQNRIRRQLRGQEGDFPPYTTDFSADFREYVAAQDIPGFGVHCFYAISKDPIISWQNVDKNILPKIAKSAVDSTTPVPHGISGVSSDPTCVCPTLGSDVTDKEEVCKTSLKSPKSPEPPKKKKKRRYGTKPPSRMLGTVAPPEEEREPPTWGTNLVEVKNIPKLEAEEEVKPAASKGAIPKRKMGGPRMPVYDGDVTDELEDAIAEFRRGEIVFSPKKKRRGLEFGATTEYGEDFEEPQQQQQEQYALGDRSPYQDVAGALYPMDFYIPEEYIDPESLRREQEIAEDAEVIEHFRRQITRADARKKVSEVAGLAQASLPAKAHIPVTTPKASTSPRRPHSPELYLPKEPIPDVGEIEVSPEKDAQLATLQAQISAAAEQEMAEVSILTQRAVEQESHLQQSPMTHTQQQQQQEEPVEPVEPPEPIQRGSPAANAIIADFMSLRESPQKHDPMFDDLQYLPLSPQRPGLETPPPFSRDPRIREAAGEMQYPDAGVEDVQWAHGPDYLQGIGTEADYAQMGDRRHLSRSQLEQIKRPKEFTEQQLKMMQHPMLREQMFFELEDFPEEFAHIDYREPEDEIFDEVEVIDQAEPSPKHQSPCGIASPAPVCQQKNTIYKPLDFDFDASFELPESPPPPHGLVDTSLPKDLSLPPPMLPNVNMELRTPEDLRRNRELSRYMPFLIPCDIECSPTTVQLSEEPDVFPMLDSFSPGLLPPTPGSPPQLPPSPPPPRQPARRGRPKQLFPGQESPSFLVAEDGSPGMLEEMSPSQFYDVEAFDSSILSPQLNIDEYEFGEYLDVDPSGGDTLFQQLPEGSPDIEQYFVQQDDFGAGISDLDQMFGDEVLEVSPPPSLPPSPSPYSSPLHSPAPHSPPPHSPRPHSLPPHSPRPMEMEEEGEDYVPPRQPNPVHQELTARMRKYIETAMHMKPLETLLLEETEKMYDELYPDLPKPIVHPEAPDIFAEEFPEEMYGLVSPSPEKPPPRQSKIVGPSGQPRPTGIPGQPGIPGPSGIAAPRGQPRPSGIPGRPGIPGPSGIAGPKGLPHPTGIPGRPGIPGPSGIAAPRGQPRPTGIPGRPGIPGPSGIAVPKGLPRPSGIPGRPGLPCPSGIQAPGGARPSGIPPPGGRGSGIPQGGAPGTSIGRGRPSGIVPPGGRQLPGGPQPPGIPRPGEASPPAGPPTAVQRSPCGACSPSAEPGESPLLFHTPEWLRAQAQPQLVESPQDHQFLANMYEATDDADLFAESPPLDDIEGMLSPVMEQSERESPYGVMLPSDPNFHLKPSRVRKREPIDQNLLKMVADLDRICGVGEDYRKVLSTPKGSRAPCRARKLDFGAPMEPTIAEEAASPQPGPSSRPSPPSPRQRPSPPRPQQRPSPQRPQQIPSPPRPQQRPSPVLFGVEPTDEELERRTPSPPRQPHLLDAPVPGGLPIPLGGLDWWSTPPHIKARLQPPPPSPPRPLPFGPSTYMEFGNTTQLPHSLHLQLQSTGDEFMGGDEDVFLVDDADLPESPPRPPPPCSPRIPSPPTPPSPPPLTPSPRVHDIFEEVGINYSPRSHAFIPSPDPFFIPKFRPKWLEEETNPENIYETPTRTVTQRSSHRRYILKTPPEQSCQEQHCGRSRHS